MILVILLNIEVDRAVALVGIAIVEDFLNQFLLLDDMACGVKYLDRSFYGHSFYMF